MKSNEKYKIIALVAGMLIMLCVGILYMWSVFQPHVVSYHGWNSSDVAMTSALMIACFVAGNIVAGLFQERIHPRIIALVGCVLFSLGIFLTSQLSSENPYMIYVTYSLISGFGCGLSYCTVLAVLQKWFSARMGFVTGMSVSFFGLSVFLLTPVTQSLLQSGGLPFTFRTLSIVFFIVTTVAAFFMKNPDKEYYYSEITKVIAPENVKQFRPLQMLKSPSYYYILFSAFTSSAGYLLMVPFITTIASDRGISETLSLFSVMCTGIANALGRILAPMVSDKLGRTKTAVICALIASVSCVIMIFAKDLLFVFGVFLVAFAYGSTSGINPVITTELFGARHSGANYGLVLISIGASSIVFGRIAAAVGAGGSFGPAFILCSLVCLVPVPLMLLLRKRVRKLGKDI